MDFCIYCTLDLRETLGVCFLEQVHLLVRIGKYKYINVYMYETYCTLDLRETLGVSGLKFGQFEGKASWP